MLARQLDISGPSNQIHDEGPRGNTGKEFQRYQVSSWRDPEITRRLLRCFVGEGGIPGGLIRIGGWFEEEPREDSCQNIQSLSERDLVWLRPDFRVQEFGHSLHRVSQGLNLSSFPTLSNSVTRLSTLHAFNHGILGYIQDLTYNNVFPSREGKSQWVAQWLGTKLKGPHRR